LADLGVDGKVIPKGVLEKQGVRICDSSVKTGSDDSLLGKR